MLKELALKNFRSYAHYAIKFESAKVMFTGSNGAGKTNLLEAIFFLTMLRSFRTSQMRDLVRHTEDAFTIDGLLERGQWTEDLRLTYAQNGGRALLRNGSRVTKSSDFIGLALPVAFIPEDIQLISGSAANRRRFFDMYLSMLDPAYQKALYHYNAALHQRNAALKRGDAGALSASAFEPVLAENGLYIVSCRHEFSSLWASEVATLLKSEPESDFSVRYEPDLACASVTDYLNHFATLRSRELKRGLTLCGPQLDEFVFCLHNQPMRNFASNGQRRKLAIYLKLAAYNILRARLKSSRISVLALVDDVTGELDLANRARFFNSLSAADQLFFTFTEPARESFFRDAEIFRIG